MTDNLRSGHEPKLATGSRLTRPTHVTSLLAADSPHETLGGPNSAASRAQEALASSPIHALRELSIERSGERLLLRGRVATFYQKQLAQEAVRAVAQGIQVENRIDVA